MSADLIDDCAIVYSGDEAIENYNLVVWAISELARRNGGAAPSIKWLAKSRRAAANARSMSDVRHETATLLTDDRVTAEPKADQGQQGGRDHWCRFSDRVPTDRTRRSAGAGDHSSRSVAVRPRDGGSLCSHPPKIEEPQ
jgi:hypothetical protein